MKVHVGCGRNYIPGWINIDIFTSVKADAYADLLHLPVEKESVDLLYACHVLEHQHRHMIVATLSYWRSLLKVGGVLRIAVPDFEAIAGWYSRTGNLDDVLGLLYGRQDHHLNRHTVAFDHVTLRRDLVRAGFKHEDIDWWDWRHTEHAQYDDFSRAYLPHMDFTNGTLMSLNLQATR